MRDAFRTRTDAVIDPDNVKAAYKPGDRMNFVIPAGFYSLMDTDSQFFFRFWPKYDTATDI